MELKALREVAELHKQTKPLLRDVNTRIEIANELEKMGSFAKALSKAILVADTANLDIISAGFTNLITQANNNIKGSK